MAEGQLVAMLTGAAPVAALAFVAVTTLALP